MALTAISVVGANGCAVGSLDALSAGSFVPDVDGGGGNDTGTSGTGPALDGSSGCRPGDVATYQPATYHSAGGAWQGVCTPDLITGFYDACLGPAATATTCAAFKADSTSARCASCIVTADTANHYGPLIDHGAFLSTNVAGCVELTDPSGLFCAKSLQAQAGCELAACKANCPVADLPSLAAYDQCANQADQGGCLTYTQLSSCLNAEGDSGLVSVCLSATFADFYAAVVPVFCGTPQVDGAVPPFDASDEASGPEDASVGDARSSSPMDAAAPFDGGRFGEGGPPPDDGSGPGPGGHDGGPFGMRDASFE